MRSTKIKLGVVCAVGELLVLVLAAMATGAGAAGAGRLGHRIRDEGGLRHGHGQEGDGHADQARRDRHADPGRRLHDGRQVRRRVLQVRQRQRRHQRPPDQVHALRRAAQPDAGGVARQEAGRERQGRRHRRQHELHRVRHQLEVLQVQGLHRDRRRRAGGVLRHADASPRSTWARATATSAPRRRSSSAARSRSSSPRPTRSRPTPTVASLKVAKAAGIPGKIFPIKLPITDANSTILQLVQAAGDGGGVILDFTPDSAPALMQAAISQGLVDKVLWGSSTPIANEFMAKQFPQFDGKMHINQEFGGIGDGTPDEMLYAQITKKYAPTIALQAFGQMGFLDRQVRDQGAPERQGPDHREVVQQRRPGAQERQDEHALQAVVRRQEPRVPHPEQHRHHRHLQGRRGRQRGQVLPRSRRSIRSSRRRVRGRRSST